MTRQERIIRAMACSGNLFLLVTLPEIRRQGMTYLSFYALQRVVERVTSGQVGPYSEWALRRETGLEDYETSRACRLLEKSGLVKISKDEGDRRIRLLRPTALGHRVLNKIMSEAGNQLWDGILPAGRTRRVKNAASLLQQANRTLLGPLQLSFFDRDLFQREPKRRRSKRQGSGRPSQSGQK
jgi:DNA-binding MarR family transcriptional regulator